MTARAKRRAYRRSCGRCGWSGSYDTSARANYAKRQHSCERQIARAAARQRRLQREASIDRAPKPCHHKRVTHVHGTYACYVHDACRCPACTASNTAYEQTRTREQIYGRWHGLVDAAPARTHVLELMSQGMGLKRVAALAGVSQSAVGRMVYGIDRGTGLKRTERIRPENAERLLAVRLDLAAGAKTDGAGTRRRLQALVAIGYPQAFLGRALGLQNVWRTIHGGGDGLVLQVTADHALELYEQLSMTPNQPALKHDRIAASRARNHARREGWLPPLAWDDDLIDDPAHSPQLTPAVAIVRDTEVDEAAVYRRMHGDKSVRLSAADRVELVRRCLQGGWTWVDIECRAGIKPDRYRVEAGAA